MAIAPAKQQLHLLQKDAVTKVTAEGRGCTIGQQLAAEFPRPESVLQLIRALRCSEATLRELLGYWLPPGPSAQRQQMPGVFTNALRLDATQLRTILGGAKAVADCPGAAPDRTSSPMVVDEPRSTLAGYAGAPAAQPTVIWRKHRRLTSPVV